MIKSGPTAPKDAATHRRAVYIMADQMIQSMKKQDQECSSEIYLDDERLVNKAEIVGGITDSNFLDEIATAEGFYSMIAAIGVSAVSEDEEMLTFRLKNYGKEDRYCGHQLEMEIPTTGVESILELEQEKELVNDAVLGQFAFLFSKENATASITVKLYLKDTVKGVEIPEISFDEPVEFMSEPALRLIKKSFIHRGNAYRFQKLYQKAKRGEEITIAFIGGSITQGAGAVPIQINCYANKTYEMLCEYLQISMAQCNFIKAGIGGTSSELGLIRYYNQVEEESNKTPDLVVVEFAVNDEGDETKGVCHESLIYKILKEKQTPAVLMLFSVFANDWNLQDRLMPIGRTYNIPMISLKDALVEQFHQKKENGSVISKRQYFYDIYHPTNLGHMMMAHCLTYALKQLMEAKEEVNDINFDTLPAIGRQFAGISYFDKKTVALYGNSINTVNNKSTVSLFREAKIQIEEGSFCETDTLVQCVERDQDGFQTPQFPYNWSYSKAIKKESFRMKIYSRSLFIMVKDSDSPAFGKADVYVDGKKILTYDSRKVGWTHANAVLLYDETRAMEHFVEIKMAPFDEEKVFTILGFGFCI